MIHPAIPLQSLIHLGRAPGTRLVLAGCVHAELSGRCLVAIPLLIQEATA